MNPLHHLARSRHALHQDHPTHRPLSEDYELVGLAGEVAFSNVFGIPVDEEVRPGGDRGVDFTLNIKFSVDVKTARKAYNLIVEKGHVNSDIYILAQYHDSTQTAEMVGWEWGVRVKRAPTKDFGYGVINHYIHRDSLRPITQLIRRAG